jgi:lipopolysaccharide export system protein LptC
MTRRAVIAILAIGALAAASGWLSRKSREPETPTAEIPSAPDYFTRNFVAVTTGPDGTPTRRLEAERMVHLPESDRLELTAPQLTLYREGASRWEVSSRRGQVEKKDSEQIVRLEGEVRLQQRRPRPFELATQTLSIYPQREYAETADPVTVTAPEGRIDAVGMEADMASRQIVLLSKARGIYEPTAR